MVFVVAQDGGDDKEISWVQIVDEEKGYILRFKTDEAVIINNRYFDTRDEAAKFVGITSAAIRYRILHKTKWLDYKYASKGES